MINNIELTNFNMSNKNYVIEYIKVSSMNIEHL